MVSKRLLIINCVWERERERERERKREEKRNKKKEIFL